MMIPQVTDAIGTKFSTQQITDALRVANYDVDRTVVTLLENAKTSSAARTSASCPYCIHPILGSQTFTQNTIVGGSLPLQIQIPRLDAVARSLSSQDAAPSKATTAAIGGSATVASIGGAPAVATLKKPSESASDTAADDFVEKKEKRPTETTPSFAPAQTQFTPSEKAAFERAERKTQDACVALTEAETSASGKAKISMVVVGHVDAGKSTITGHLLYRLGYVSQKLMHKYEKESREAGKASFAYAWVMDADDDEVRTTVLCVVCFWVIGWLLTPLY